jgi:putative lipoic acid-binding regulatory protein
MQQLVIALHTSMHSAHITWSLLIAALHALSIQVTFVAKERTKYISVSLRLYVTSSDQLYSAYEAIDKDERVKFKF